MFARLRQTGNKSGEKQKQERKKNANKSFMLDFYFSGFDSAYSYTCPNDWTYLPETNVNCLISIKLPNISKYSRQVKDLAAVMYKCVKIRKRKFGFKNTFQRNQNIESEQYSVIFGSNDKLKEIDGSQGLDRGKARNSTYIYHQARIFMQETFPSDSYAIFIIFIDNPIPLLLSMSSSMIGDLIFQLRRILFCPLLLNTQYVDVIIYVILKFILCVIKIIQSFNNCDQFKNICYHLLNNYLNMEKKDCLAEIRTLFIDIWCTLLGAASSGKMNDGHMFESSKVIQHLNNCESGNNVLQNTSWKTHKQSNYWEPTPLQPSRSLY